MPWRFLKTTWPSPCHGPNSFPKQSLINECKTPVLNTSPEAMMFGTIDGSFEFTDIMELDFDIGVHFAFLDTD